MVVSVVDVSLTLLGRSPSRTTTPHEVLPYHASSVDLEAAVRSRSHSRADDLEMSAGSSDDCTTTASQKAHTGDV